jgi:hypothetical protein
MVVSKFVRANIKYITLVLLINRQEILIGSLNIVQCILEWN